MERFRIQIKLTRQWIWLAVLGHLVYCQNNTNEIIDYSSSIYQPSWVYRCVQDQGCQRSEVPHYVKNGTLVHSHLTFESLDLCKTVCGRFGGLWPKPTTAALSMHTVKIHPNYLRFDLVNAPMETRDLLVHMSHVVTSNLLAECDGNVTDLVTTPVVVYIAVTSPDITLTWETNESYVLDIQNKDGTIAIHIFAETVYGARHGLESFTQLVSGDKADESNGERCSLQMISGAKIRDKPAYKHRGFLLDTSRHFIPMKDIKRMIDGMAASKMNVFHWHVTDTHSFPLESNRVPQFTRYGAYSPSEIYSVEEVREFIRYAQIRGVRVMIEIDAPAHAGNGWQWGREFGYGDLAVCVNAKPWRGLCIQPPCGQLNPINPYTYKVLKDLYYDIAEMITKPALLHMGGDEVFLSCWNSTEDIVNHLKLKGQNLTEENYIRLWSDFHKQSLSAWDEAVDSVGSKPQPVMIWSSGLTQAPRITKYLDASRYVIQVWEKINNPLLNQLIRLGYKAVSVPKDIWYLDHGFWGSTTFSNWRRMYQHSLPIHENVLGGEVAMWTEYVDEMTLDARVWPRAAAVAENLWSNPNTLNSAEPRLERHRSRLIARGIKPDVLSPAWCAQHDGKCL